MNGNDCKVSSGFTTYRKYKKSPFYSLFFRSTYFRAALTIVRLWHRSPFFRSTFFRKLFYLFDIFLFWHFPCRHLVVCFIFPKLFSSTIMKYNSSSLKLYHKQTKLEVSYTYFVEIRGVLYIIGTFLLVKLLVS